MAFGEIFAGHMAGSPEQATPSCQLWWPITVQDLIHLALSQS